MFAPNRFLTSKEQVLLAGVMAAIFLGCISLYFFQGESAEQKENAFPLEHHGAPSPSAPPRPMAEPPAALPLDPPSQALVTEKPEPEMTEPLHTGEAHKLKEAGVAAMGALRRPGFYRIPADSRISELIHLAGGALESADLSEIMLTARVIDGTTLTIPYKAVVEKNEKGIRMRRQEGDFRLNPAPYLRHAPVSSPAAGHAPSPEPTGNNAAGAQISTSANVSGTMVNVNTASSEELQRLPGIGPVLASSIVAERQRQPFGSVEDLQRVPGIGEKRLDAIRQLVTVE